MMEKNARSRHQRAPKKALDGPSPERRTQKPAMYHGGYPIDLAERHLSNFYTENVPDAQDVFHFRTTRALVVAARRWRRLANERVKGIGQNMARWETLYLMASSEEELSQGELARVIGVKGPTMVSMLNALARDGLIERYQGNSDRRITHNHITDKGRQVARDIMTITNDLRTEVLRGIDPDKLAIALDVLETIHVRLDEVS